MRQPPEVPPQSSPAPHRRLNKAAWIFIIIGTILLLLFVALVILIFNSINAIDNMLTDKPKVAAYQPDKVNKKQLEAKMALLETAQKQGSECRITITADDINTYFAEHSLGREDGDTDFRLRFAINDGKLRCMVAIPIRDKKDGRLRYFNCDAEFTATLVDGKLDVRLKKLSFGPGEAPLLLRILVAQLKDENLAQDIYRNPKYDSLRRKLSYCKELSIDNNVIRLLLQFPAVQKKDSQAVREESSPHSQPRNRMK